MPADLAVVQRNDQEPDLTAIERVVVAGDLGKLTPDERWSYYRGVCQSVGLNPFTQPFLYITLSGKLTLYATKGAADQLRDHHHISIAKPAIDLTDGLCIVTVTATDKSGRTDSDLGIVPIENLRGDAKANAILKAVTKAKRRVTLSMCGLGMLDETEVEAIPNAKPANIEPVPSNALPFAGAAILAAGGDDIDGRLANNSNAQAMLAARAKQFDQQWTRGTEIAREVGATIPDRPDPSADSKDKLTAALTDLRANIAQARANRLAALTAEANALGLDVEEIDAATLAPAALQETIDDLTRMIGDAQAALRGEGQPDLQDDDTAF